MSKMRVLVAAKMREVAERYSAALEANGFECMIARDGLQANQLAGEEPFAAILTTAKLERLSGMQVAATARTSTVNAKVPIFVVTDLTDREVRSRCEQLRATVVGPTENEGNLAKSILSSTQQGATYDVRLINAFVTAVATIFKNYLGSNPEIGKASVKKDEIAYGYVSSLIDFTGNGVRGSMALSFDRGLLKELNDKMFPGMNVDFTDDAMADLAGEMANQVCGVVKTSVGKLGLKVMIGLPKVVVGNNHRIIHVVKNPTLVLIVKSGEDKCSVEFCMSRVSKEDFQETETDDKVSGDVMLF